MAGRQATSTIRRRRIGSFLRTLREEHDPVVLSKDAAAHIGIDATRLGRIEKGRYRVTPEQISGLLEFYGVTDQVAHEELCKATLEDPTSHWWYAYRKYLTSAYTDFIALEHEATKIETVSSQVVPGLLQCASYIKEIQETALVKDMRERSDALFSARMSRQQAITRPTNPAMYKATITESILSFDAPCMADQIRHLITMDDQPNVSIRIVPADAPLGAQHLSPVTLLEFSYPWPVTIHADSAYGGILDEESNSVEYVREIFEGLDRYALPAENTREFLENQLRKISS